MLAQQNVNFAEISKIQNAVHTKVISYFSVLPGSPKHFAICFWVNLGFFSRSYDIKFCLKKIRSFEDESKVSGLEADSVVNFENFYCEQK